MEHVAILNADYNFVNFVDVKRAIALIVKGRVEVLKYSDKVIKSFSATFNVPLVLRLVKLIRLAYKSKVPFTKKGVFIRDDYQCVYCGTQCKKPTVDHVVPGSKGGQTSWENCVTACNACNVKKKNHSCREAGMYPKRKPIAPTISEFLSKRFVSLGFNKVLENLFNEMT